MKIYTGLLVFCMSCFVAVGAGISEDELERLERTVKIGSVNDDTVENDADEEFEQLKFYTYQNEDDDYNFRMRVTMELTDRSKNTYFAQLMKPRGVVSAEYTGEDNWKFEVPHGDLERPKVTAYVVQYGIQLGSEFVVLAEETDDVDTVEELTERSPTRLEQKPAIQHQYSYRDGDDEVIQSQWK